MNFESASYKTKDAPDLNDFDWLDPFKLSDLLEEHEVLIKESAASFANDVLMPIPSAIWMTKLNLMIH